MKEWANRILFILISISFALAVFEIDLGSSHNTFHDEDDTYIQSNNQNAELSCHFEKQKDLTREYCDFAIAIFNFFLSNTQVDSNSSSPKKDPLISQKIFVRNSVWRI